MRDTLIAYYIILGKEYKLTAWRKSSRNIKSSLWSRNEIAGLILRDLTRKITNPWSYIISTEDYELRVG
jgi:hypothetical protein